LGHLLTCSGLTYPEVFPRTSAFSVSFLFDSLRYITISKQNTCFPEICSKNCFIRNWIIQKGWLTGKLRQENFTLEQAFKVKVGVEVESTLSLTSVLDRGCWSRPGPWSLYAREKRNSIQFIQDRASPRFGLDGCGIYRPHRDSIPAPSKP
jgi:hypothetical protein